ncbi:acyl carrier protein [Kitasatospora sp. NBC_01266]|uniref:acyl carrier protein n=1 Tax=Kitasatospora sp. NBC_01266 TaxID=2903572 RepID=UPI002E33B39E|nr:acyl carrier protein [Kitasatospora sp. NBC_01266]
MNILAEVVKALSEASDLPVAELPADASLESLGLSSIHVMSAYVSLERVLDISFTGGDLRYAPTDTVRELAAAIGGIHAAR